MFILEVKQEQLAVQVTNLRLKFPGESSLIFKDLSFSVPQGQKVLLLGPSGCGKSTLLQVLSGIIPHSIEVPFKYDTIQHSSSWGFVFQDPDTQFCMPFVDEELAFVLENLCIPRSEMEPLMKQALSAVGLQIDELHTSIHTLSQGMKQRLALASVLLLQPEVLYLDEPSAMLDPEGTVHIWDTVKDVASSKTIIIVEHKIEQIVDWVDRIVLFNHSGAIIADGCPDQVFTNFKAELIKYGIWYPGVWQDYIEGEAYLQMMLNRERAEEIPIKQAVPTISLHGFSGYHGLNESIAVPSAEAYSGEWIAIRGHNGAGKSTLLLSLMQLLRTSGTYRIHGKIVEPRTKRKGLKQSKRSSLINELAFVFQNPELQFVTNSIKDEIALSLKLSDWPDDQIDFKINEWLVTFDLHVNRERHPYQLSSGQKRRLSVASAMVKEQAVLLLDEPTFGQDAKNTFAILEILEQLRSRGTTIMMITHDPHIIRYFSTKVWDISQGKLTEIVEDKLTEIKDEKLTEVTNDEFIHTSS